MLQINELKELRELMDEANKLKTALGRIDGAVSYILGKIPKKDRQAVIEQLKAGKDKTADELGAVEIPPNGKILVGPKLVTESASTEG